MPALDPSCRPLLSLADAQRHWGHRSELSNQVDPAQLKAWDRQAWCLDIQAAFADRPELDRLCFVDPLDASASPSTWRRHIHVVTVPGDRDDELTHALRRLAWFSPGFSAEVVLHPPIDRDGLEKVQETWAGPQWVSLRHSFHMARNLPPPNPVDRRRDRL